MVGEESASVSRAVRWYSHFVQNIYLGKRGIMSECFNVHGFL